MKRIFGVVVLLAVSVGTLWADDWPEYRGQGRRGVWAETGILETFPADGLKVLWRTPVKGGYSGTAVSNGRVFLTDFTVISGSKGTERALALDEQTGRVLWTYEWEATYAGLMWAHGPRATPTVDGDRVYVVGAMGLMYCLDVETGEVLWQKDYVVDYDAPVSMWGIAGSPVIEDNLLITIVNGTPYALIVAFDKKSGEEVWRALPSMAEPGINSPMVINAGGTRQLIYWSPEALHSLNPVTGEVYWAHPWRVGDAMNLALPVHSGSELLVSHFARGSRLFSLDKTKPMATEIWHGESTSEIFTDGLHSMYGTPVIYDGHIYGICSYGQMRCLRASTGERIWETQEVTQERARWASGHLVRNGNRVFINNDRGELIIARLTPEGYQEIDRTALIKPTTPPGVRRQLGAIHVSHPAYANQNIYVRNDEEVVAYSLAATGSEVVLPRQRKVEVDVSPTRDETLQETDEEKRVHVQYMPGLSDPSRRANPTGTAYSTLHLLSGGGAHTVVFTTDNGVVLVNTKRVGWGQALKDAMDYVTNDSVTTIINTHPDVEYTGNNAEFPSVVDIVAHDNTRNAMEDMASFTGSDARFLPNKTYTDTLSLFSGRNQIDLYHFGRAYTDGDTVVVFPAFGLAYLGELFPSKAVPRIDTENGGSALAFVETLTKVIATLERVENSDGNAFIVPGRGAPAHTGNLLTGLASLRDLREYADFTQEFLAAVKDARSAGKTVDDAVVTLVLPEKYRDYDMTAAKATIQVIYDELSQ